MRRDCTECGSFDTKRVNTEWSTDMVAETRVCNECPTQFTNKYSLFEKETDSTEDTGND